MSVCRVPFSCSSGSALSFGGDQVHAEHRHGRPGDRHRGGDLAEVDAVEQRLHVGRGIDRNPAVPDLAERPRIVGVPAHQGGHVERDAQPVPALAEDHLVPLVGVDGIAEPGELPDRPWLPAIPGGVQAAGERELPGQPIRSKSCDDIAGRRPVDRVDRHPGQGGVVDVVDPAGGLGGSEPLLPPAATGGDTCRRIGRPCRPGALVVAPSNACTPPPSASDHRGPSIRISDSRTTYLIRQRRRAIAVPRASTGCAPDLPRTRNRDIGPLLPTCPCRPFNGWTRRRWSTVGTRQSAVRRVGMSCAERHSTAAAASY